MISDLAAYLLSHSTITDIVGQNLWLFRVPQDGPYPAITLHIIGRPHLHNLDGRSGYSKTRVQIDCWSNSYKQATDMADAIGDLIDGFTGVMGTTTFGWIASDEDTGETHFYEPPADGGDFGLHHLVTDYFCCYFE